MGAEYGLYLEEGAEDVGLAARPFMGPAFEDAQNRIEADAAQNLGLDTLMEAQAALQKTLYAYLVGTGAQLWGNRVMPTEIAASGAVYPYVSYFLVSGGREYQTQSRTARLTMTVKGVCGQSDGISDPYAVALAMQGILADLLTDTGEQDINPIFPTQADWAFLTIGQGRTVYQAVQISDSQWSYHAGHQYEFLMSKK